METFKLTDHAHYERNAPGYPQAVFFDVEPPFHHKLSKAVTDEMLKVGEEEGNMHDVFDWGTILSRLAQAVERELGPLTLAQMLYSVHFISAQLAYNTGKQDGYELALDANKPVTTLSKKSKSNKQATA